MVSGRSAGTHKYWPVTGGSSFSSLARSARAAAIFPPADAPPKMRPTDGEAFNSALFVITHFSASQQSFTPVGNLCSGARLRVAQRSLVSQERCVRHLPILYIGTNGAQVPSKHTTIEILICQIAHAPPSFVEHDDGGLPPSDGPATGWYTRTRMDAPSRVGISCSVSVTLSGIGPGMWYR